MTTCLLLTVLSGLGQHPQGPLGEAHHERRRRVRLSSQGLPELAGPGSAPVRLGVNVKVKLLAQAAGLVCLRGRRTRPRRGRRSAAPPPGSLGRGGCSPRTPPSARPRSPRPSPPRSGRSWPAWPAPRSLPGPWPAPPSRRLPWGARSPVDAFGQRRVRGLDEATLVALRDRPLDARHPPFV